MTETEIIRRLKALQEEENELRREALGYGKTLWETWLRCIGQAKKDLPRPSPLALYLYGTWKRGRP